jgi:hypothetical protein
LRWSPAARTDREASDSDVNSAILGISEMPHCLMFLSARIPRLSDARKPESASTRACDAMEPIDYMMALFAGVCIGFAGLAFMYAG